MKDKNIFLNFLYLLSKEKIANNLYLEGGFVLSFVYGIDRVFSNDIDFTIDNFDKNKELFAAIKKVSEKLNLGEVILLDNSVLIKNEGVSILQLDFYPLDKKLFSWQNIDLVYEKKKFLLKAHSLEDIFAEKISNVFQERRCEFKDIFDIVSMYTKFKDDFDNDDFCLYLIDKLKGKKLYSKIKNDPLLFLLNRKSDFENSYDDYPMKNKLDFESKFSEAARTIENFF